MTRSSSTFLGDGFAFSSSSTLAITSALASTRMLFGDMSKKENLSVKRRVQETNQQTSMHDTSLMQEIQSMYDRIQAFLQYELVESLVIKHLS